MSREKNHTIPPELRARLDQEDPADREALEHVWRLIGERHFPDEEVPDADETWNAVQSRQADDRPARKHSRRFAIQPRWIGTAVLLAVLAGGVLFWRQPMRVVAPAGEHVSLTLPDGSTVELSSGSTLTYQRGFTTMPLLPARQRRASVEGGAFFDVAQEGRPFIVETFNARVEVLGTQFVVQAWPEAGHPETQVTLASGRVRFTARSSTKQTVTLQEAGQTSRVVGTTSAPSVPKETDLDQALAWRQQGFYASDEPLSAILERLERRYGTRLVLQAPTVATDSMTLYYAQKTDLEAILHDICVAKGLKYRTTSQGYEIIRHSSATE